MGYIHTLGIDTYKHTLVGLYWCMFLITTTFNFFVEAFFKYESNFNTRKLLHVQQFSRSSWFMLQWRSDLLEYSFRSFPLCLIEHLKPFDGFAHVGKRKPYNNFWPINIGYDCQLKIVDVSSFLFYFILFLKLCNTWPLIRLSIFSLTYFDIDFVILQLLTIIDVLEERLNFHQ